MQPARPLLKNQNFLRLWTGETISMFGSMITGVAYPLTAALVLNATATEMGILYALETAPFLLIGLFAGAWIDRVRRRPVLIAADLGRAVLIALVPLAMLLNLLSIEVLYVAGFLFGVLTVFFDVAYQSFVPHVVTRDHIVEANSKLEVSRSAAQIVGPGLGGVLVQLLTAPFALLFDAVSFLCSALFMSQVRAEEPLPERHGVQQSIWQDIREGLGVVFGNQYLRAIIGCTALTNLAMGMWSAVQVLFFTRQLGLEPATIGLVMSIAAPGALLGALVANRVAQRFGLGPTIILSAILGGIAMLPVPFVSAGLPGLITIGLSMLLINISFVIYNVNQVSLRQSITPDRLLGRVTATIRCVVWGIMPIGALVGGKLGDVLGLRPVLGIAAFIGAIAFLSVLLSPVRTLRETPRPAAIPEPA